MMDTNTEYCITGVSLQTFVNKQVIHSEIHAVYVYVCVCVHRHLCMTAVELAHAHTLIQPIKICTRGILCRLYNILFVIFSP